MITLSDNDDPRFIAIAGRLLDAAITESRPAEIYLIRIDQWFDAKWLNFSGKTLGALSVWRGPTTIPPFHPHRVTHECHFTTSAESGSIVTAPASPLHISQPSSRNLTRSIAKVSPSAVFLWFSSSTRDLDRGSMMLYRSYGDDVFSWYASFHRSPTWRLDRHQGISPTELQRQLQCD